MSSNQKLQFRRFTHTQRLLHLFMIISFITLALTGMTLKFAYTSWAYFISHLLGGFEVAGAIHRVAAVIMIIVFTSHLVDLLRTKKKNAQTWKDLIMGPDAMLFNRKDWEDFRDSMLWFLGRGERPQYGRWTYWEKFDYFAVFWGIFVIGSTGAMLWFPEFFTRFLPGWVINVATIVHSDEALLATGFIFTVHFFNTHLRPEKFPMDIIIFTGRTSLEEYKLDRPAEYKELVEKGELEKHLVEPYPQIVITAVKMFGWAALTTGLFIVVWIIYAMIFAYK